MKDPNIKVNVVHSQKNSAWNITGTQLGGKFKIARVPYTVSGHVELDVKNRIEAREHAEFIAHCFNNSNKILKDGTQIK